METRLDGNAAAGILEAIFAFEITTIECTCNGCGRVRMMGETAVYRHGMGTIVRCPDCDTALVRVAEIKERYWLDMRGIRVVQFPVGG